MTSIPALRLIRIDSDFPVSELSNGLWSRAENSCIDRDWSGGAARTGREFSAQLLWSERALYARFDAALAERLVIVQEPDLTQKTLGLWERDVCEIFIAPDAKEPWRYFEFEVAPTGEWLDLAIDHTSGERITDWDYKSGMEASAKIEEGRFLTGMKIPWEAFGKKPKPGDVWLGNIFRCVGREPDRGYLAWRPTYTERPNFHVPEAFGQFMFVGQ